MCVALQKAANLDKLAEWAGLGIKRHAGKFGLECIFHNFLDPQERIRVNSEDCTLRSALTDSGTEHSTLFLRLQHCTIVFSSSCTFFDDEVASRMETFHETCFIPLRHSHLGSPTSIDGPT